MSYLLDSFNIFPIFALHSILFIIILIYTLRTFLHLDYYDNLLPIFSFLDKSTHCLVSHRVKAALAPPMTTE